MADLSTGELLIASEIASNYYQLEIRAVDTRAAILSLNLHLSLDIYTYVLIE